MGFIYKITNKNNNKIYIGQTRRTVEVRWKEHIRDSFKPSRSHTSILHSAIRKYGEQSFTIEQIEECNNNQLNAREKYWIKYYNSCLNGYNISLGGNGYLKCTDEEILNLWDEGLAAGEIAIELDLCSDTVSIRLKNCGIPPEEIQSRGRKFAAKQLKHPVYKYDLYGNFLQEYPSINEAEASINGQKINFPPDYIQPIGGFQWRRQKYDKIESFYDRKVIRKDAKMVYQYTLDGEYIQSFCSTLEAAKAVKAKSHMGIVYACNGKYKTSSHYRWSYSKVDKLPPLK